MSMIIKKMNIGIRIEINRFLRFDLILIPYNLWRSNFNDRIFYTEIQKKIIYLYLFNSYKLNT